MQRLEKQFGNIPRIGRRDRFGQFRNVHPVNAHRFKSVGLWKHDSSGLPASFFVLRVMPLLLCDVPNLSSIDSKSARSVVTGVCQPVRKASLKVAMAAKLERSEERRVG